MAIMTIGTETCDSVVTMAASTVLLAVSTRHLGKVLLHLSMTADTDRCMRLEILQSQHQRLVRRMTALAIANGIVRMIAWAMTHKA